MGTPIPPIVEPPPVGPGDLCSNCWGPGKPFGDGDTPLSLFINVSGMNEGPGWNPGFGDPPAGPYELFQNLAAACEFLTEEDDWRFRVVFLPSTTQSNIVFLPGTVIFATTPNPACSLSLLNVLTDIFVDGSMVISFGEPI